MENNFKQYELLLGSAVEIKEVCQDTEGGAFLLIWTSELIRELATVGHFRSARLTVQKLCEATGVDWTWAEYDALSSKEKSAWPNLFAEILMDHVMTVIEQSRDVDLLLFA